MISKISKFFLYTILLSSLLILPIYGAARLILPDYIKKEIIKNLPSGSTLRIGSVTSKSDLSLIFEDVDYSSESNDIVLKSKKIELLPKLSFSQPLKVLSEELYFNQPHISGMINNLNAEFILNHNNQKKISISGQIKKIESSNSVEFSNLEFFLNGINQQNKIINLNAKKIIFKFENQFGSYGIKAHNINSRGEFKDNSIYLSVNFEDFELNLSELEEIKNKKIVYSDTGKIDLNLFEEESWQAPINFYFVGIRASNNKIAETIKISSTGHWSKVEKKCGYMELLENKLSCGTITDFLNTKISIDDGNDGLINANGDGFCVTPNANCPQRIKAEIKSKKTAQIFSSIMLSGFINPLLGGVLLSGLMTSPVPENELYDHSVLFEMIGNKILLNNSPLF